MKYKKFNYVRSEKKTKKNMNYVEFLALFWQIYVFYITFMSLFFCQKSRIYTFPATDPFFNRKISSSYRKVTFITLFCHPTTASNTKKRNSISYDLFSEVIGDFRTCYFRPSFWLYCYCTNHIRAWDRTKTFILCPGKYKQSSFFRMNHR